MMNLLFSPSGRLAPGPFMTGAIVLSVLLFVVKVLPLVSVSVAGIAGIIGLVLIYCWFALFIKRYHDAGKTGWLALIPLAIIVPLGLFVEGWVQGLVAPETVAATEALAAEAMESGGFGGLFEAGEEIQALGAELARETALAVAITRGLMAFSVAWLFNRFTQHDPTPNQYGAPMGEADTFE